MRWNIIRSHLHAVIKHAIQTLPRRPPRVPSRRVRGDEGKAVSKLRQRSFCRMRQKSQQVFVRYCRKKHKFNTVCRKRGNLVCMHGHVPGMQTPLQKKRTILCAQCAKLSVFSPERGTGGNQKATAERSIAQSVWVPSEAVDFAESLRPLFPNAEAEAVFAIKYFEIPRGRQPCP